MRLAVDVGSVRVGVAASDPDGLLATPVETVPRGDTVEGGVSRLVEIVQERDAVVVYVGLPRHLSGREGSASEAARTYGVLLARALAPVPVRLIDERMSTVSAHRAMHASGRPGRRQRAVVDQAAAVVILQSALDFERSTGRRAGEPCESDGGGVEQREVSW
ncbi:Holliday junction resolvase RuvX [Actinotalea sp. M2MS4P-6]|nr:Holliday junction resolvase RuvX [Actinotalea sp. M2MS4P-6]